MTESLNGEFSLAVFLATNWMNILFGLFGVAGAIIGFASWHSSRKSSAAYAHLFELADRHIDKSLTDKKLLYTKQQLKQEVDRIKELQRKIQHEIPIEARRAVLRDKLETNIEQIHEVYTSLQGARDQLQKLGEQAEIPTEIREEIDIEIQPEYLAKRKKSDLRNYLTIITATAAISSALLPHPFSRLASWFVLGMFGLPVTFLLARLSWKEWRMQLRETVLPFVTKHLFKIGLGFIFLSIGFFSVTGTYSRHILYVEYGFGIWLVLIFFVSGMVAILMKLGILTRRWWLTRRSTRPPSSAREL